jgi:hypothetical protein
MYMVAPLVITTILNSAVIYGLIRRCEVLSDRVSIAHRRIDRVRACVGLHVFTEEELRNVQL